MLFFLALGVVLAASNPVLAPADPTVIFQSLDGSSRRLSLGDLGQVTDPREGYAAHRIRFEDVERPEEFAAWEERADLAMLELSGGDRLRARIVGGNDEALAATLVGDVALRLSIEDLRSVRFEERLRENTGGLRVEPAAEGDVIYRVVQNSLDRIEGTLLEFGRESVTFEVARIGDAKTYPWTEIGAIFIEDLGGEEGTAVEGVSVTVDLVDLGRVTAALGGVNQDGIRLEMDGGTELALPLWAIDQVTVRDGRLAYLSDLAPNEADEGSPFGDDLGMVWPHRMDRSVTGHPLRSGKTLFTRGIGVHSPSRLSWDLSKIGAGGWRALRGAVAIDDEVLHLGSRGSVTFAVALDGDVVWESPIVRGGDPPLDLPAIDVTGKSRLSLIVGMATDLHVADRANWLQVYLTQ